MSAVIWLGIVAVWGFVLIPRWLRHHDGVVEQRSVDRFHTAMRVLARRGAERRYAVGPSGPHRPYAPARRTPSSLARVRVRRARRLLALLVAVPATALFALVLGGLWTGVQLIADAALVGYVVFLRRKARTEQRLRAARIARDRRAQAARAAWQASLADPDAAREPVVDDEPDTDELPPVAARAGGPAHRRSEAGPPYAPGDVAVADPREVSAAVAERADADRAAHHGGTSRPTHRPGGRPATSRPGRVQVNPPGAPPPDHGVPEYVEHASVDAEEDGVPPARHAVGE